MAFLNKVMLIGNLGRDPETRYMPDGGAVTNASIATTERWKDKQGDTQEKTEWHRLVFFNKLAEIAGEYLKKGSPVYVEGKITTRQWEDKEGVMKYTTEIVVHQMQMLGRKSDNEGGGERDTQQYEQRQRDAATKPATRAAGAASKFDDMDDDIPF